MGAISRRIRALYNKANWYSSLAISHLRAKLPNIRKRWQGDRFSTPAKKHAVFVHFDTEGVIHDYVIKYLDDLRDCGFEITFVTNSPEMPDESVALLKPLCRLIVHRYNSGYDFAAYRDGIRQIPNLDQCEALILANDSVYGPLFSLKDELAGLDPETLDVWGITDSWEFNYHVQSYFMLFFPRALRSKAFKKFWKRFPNLNNKHFVIKRGEIRLAQRLARDKLRIKVQCPYWEVAADHVTPLRSFLSAKTVDKFSPLQVRWLQDMEDKIVLGIPLNPSHSFWERVIRERGCLFLKRELIQKNPLSIPFVWRWKDVVDECTDYDSDLISRHLHSL
ncbi:polysaccharide biosynthesis-like protein [Zhengella mangrovi]|uniref:Polysaccharide biosynthesis-like protein n=1 Tax=Zhengella mangrovi TaxID=1982044 RepID=A0A2G1QJ66_9HYPH|nr:rhamnan synthesis F family protein [Zhengella mangrovi]PHP65587.1 polysaccharide biosynthesis-like protein [Zhengella mangrovi]